jgi:hypothetical protein
MNESVARDPSAQKRLVNDRIREGLQEYAPDAPDAPIAFFCECGVDNCYRVAWLTGGDYDEARRDEALAGTRRPPPERPPQPARDRRGRVARPGLVKRVHGTSAAAVGVRCVTFRPASGRLP